MAQLRHGALAFAIVFVVKCMSFAEVLGAVFTSFIKIKELFIQVLAIGSRVKE